jgi:hypothetical protein
MWRASVAAQSRNRDLPPHLRDGDRVAARPFERVTILVG